MRLGLLVVFHRVEGRAQEVPEAGAASAGGGGRRGDGALDLLEAFGDQLFEEFFLAGEPVVESAVRQAGFLSDPPGGRRGDAVAGDDGTRGADELGAAAYPFSGTPTTHQVHPRGGPPVWAMCALDALGVLLMARTDGTVSSSDPDTGTPVRAERRGGRWQWQPAEAVMLMAFTSASQPSAEGLCPQIDFYQDAEGARAHLNAHASLVGQAVSQVTAVELADRVFGPLLSE